MKARSLVYAGIALAALAVAAWALMPRPVRVELATVATGRFEQTIEEEGKARVSERFVVSAPVSGLLERSWLKVGDGVEPGAVVGVIRPAPPAIRDARTSVELRERAGAAEAALARAQAGVGQARAGLDRLSADYERTRKLAGQGYVSASVEEQSRAALRQQAELLKAAQFEAEAAAHELGLARAARREGPIAADPKRPEPRWEIRSARGGTVLKLLLDSETVVASGTPMLEIGDVRALEVVAELLSQDAAGVAPGMAVRLTAGRAVAPFEGRVRLVEPTARTKVSTLGIEEQRVNVVIDPVPAAPAGVGDGYRVNIAVVTRVEEGARLLPLGAIFRDGDGWSVFAVEQGVARRRRVELAGRNQQSAWIGGGLADGASVVVYPPDTLADGMRVTPR